MWLLCERAGRAVRIASAVSSWRSAPSTSSRSTRKVSINATRRKRRPWLPARQTKALPRANPGRSCSTVRFFLLFISCVLFFKMLQLSFIVLLLKKRKNWPEIQWSLKNTALWMAASFSPIRSTTVSPTLLVMRLKRSTSAPPLFRNYQTAPMVSD